MENNGSNLAPAKIDRSLPVPLYNQIYSQLKKELMLGIYKEGQRFFSYRKLKSIYNVELRTVAEAVNLLIKEGFLFKKPASGTYVGNLNKVKDNGVFAGNIWYVLLGNEDFDHPFYFRLLKGIERKIDRTGLKLIVGIKKNSKEFSSWFTPASGDGIILTGEVKPSILKSIETLVNDKLVVIGVYDEKLMGTNNISVNAQRALLEALNATSKFGISSLGVIAGAKEKFITKLLVKTGKSFASSKGLKWTGENLDEAEDGYMMLTNWNDRNVKLPDCLIVTEPAYYGVCRYAMEHNIKCPGELCIIRYGREPGIKIFEEYSAINVFADTETIGEKAVTMLLNNREKHIELDMRVEINNT